eukprot:gnl/Chilomastix_cuspidata/3895.p1 GENE.gnl/Chilomastix_cuspidata/3895~~gnl/Chilomastix_cuspidata/3895.p1  ORF type:complete len:814 (+),score=251.74 gnl/Chilomastix_cuspidata/3895:56-2497(+)
MHWLDPLQCRENKLKLRRSLGTRGSLIYEKSVTLFSSPVRHLSFSPFSSSGYTLMCGGEGFLAGTNISSLINTNKTSVIPYMINIRQDSPNDIAFFGPDEIGVACESGKVRTISLSKLSSISTRRLHFQRVNSISTPETGPARWNMFATAGVDGRISISDRRAGEEPVLIITNPHNLPPSGRKDDVQPAKMVRDTSIPRQRRNDTTTCVRFYDDHTMISSGSLDGSAKVWDLRVARGWNGNYRKRFLQHVSARRAGAPRNWNFVPKQIIWPTTATDERRYGISWVAVSERKLAILTLADTVQVFSMSGGSWGFHHEYSLPIFNRDFRSQMSWGGPSGDEFLVVGTGAVARDSRGAGPFFAHSPDVFPPRPSGVTPLEFQEQLGIVPVQCCAKFPGSESETKAVAASRCLYGSTARGGVFAASVGTSVSIFRRDPLIELPEWCTQLAQASEGDEFPAVKRRDVELFERWLISYRTWLSYKGTYPTFQTQGRGLSFQSPDRWDFSTLVPPNFPRLASPPAKYISPIPSTSFYSATPYRAPYSRRRAGVPEGALLPSTSTFLRCTPSQDPLFAPGRRQPLLDNLSQNTQTQRFSQYRTPVANSQGDPAHTNISPVNFIQPGEPRLGAAAPAVRSQGSSVPPPSIRLSQETQPPPRDPEEPLVRAEPLVAPGTHEQLLLLIISGRAHVSDLTRAPPPRASAESEEGVRRLAASLGVDLSPAPADSLTPSIASSLRRIEQQLARRARSSDEPFQAVARSQTAGEDTEDALRPAFSSTPDGTRRPEEAAAPSRTQSPSVDSPPRQQSEEDALFTNEFRG